ncbi:neuronal acetylcholine receptor subunit alpha-2-like [Dendronephthya gigantea]|uniref:neuronal acetylcholine receptor subunit alpha-2-like n=1 Tax=Dendronephthya gigantea TaxID=151771 RepID=UPI00106BE235|nr:neuronal acetylcholine receptor subunit alpha-2-like [Dendronephthya gigantea]
MASLFLAVQILSALTSVLVSEGSYHEKRLLSYLSLDGYKKDMRPVANDSDKVMVKIGLTLSQIIDVDGRNQIMTTSVWTRQQWYNPYLKWNASEYGNITSINVKSSRVWLPDMVLYNNADESIDFRGNLDRLSTRVQLFHTGINMWLAPVMLRSKCKINVQYFPFDTQNCTMKFGSWTYDGNRVDVKKESDTADLSKYIESGEWKLVAAPVRKNVQKYYCCPEPYPDITFYFIIHRRSLFYLTNLILPLVIISCLIIFVFTLPPESGERISLTITLLLSMMVFMLVITEQIPATSDVVPLVAKFYMAVMLEMALALVITCYVIRCYHSHTNEPPRWMRKILVKKFANFFGVKKSKELKMAEKEEGKLSKVKTEKGRGDGLLKRLLSNGSVKRIDGSEDMNNGNSVLHSSDAQTVAMELETPNFSRERVKTADSIEKKLLGNVEYISSSIQDRAKQELVKEEWLIVANVIDRIAIWLFTIIMISTMVSIFYQAPGYVG